MKQSKQPRSSFHTRIALGSALALALFSVLPAMAQGQADAQAASSTSVQKTQTAGQQPATENQRTANAAKNTPAASQPAKQSGGARTNTPKATIQYLHGSLIQAMKHAKSLGYSGRYKKLVPVIRQTHDLTRIAQTTLGSEWGKLTQAQQSKFVDTFTHLTIATYAGRFDGYSGEKFKFVKTQKLSSEQSLVRSYLIKSDGSKVTFDYVLRNENGHWKIINIVVNGVSDLALKRAEYTDVLKKKGFQGLLKKLDSKISSYGGKH